jgi:AmmeMemoRadiSam system protein B/AmmeMemoRadiSam system protein A
MRMRDTSFRYERKLALCRGERPARTKPWLLAVAVFGALAASCRSSAAGPASPAPAQAPAPAVAKVRAPAVAGSWYPADPRALASLIDRMLAAATTTAEIAADARVLALVEPHAGYQFSGPVAAYGYRAVQGKARRRVILLGPAHRGFFRGASILDVTHYRTPLGDIPLDLDAVARLRKEPLVGAHPDADEGEHSLEMQLPFLQRALQPGWRLVPILVGALEAGDDARLAAALRPLVDDDTLVVASGDFTHYGPSYGYQPFPADGQVAANLRALDDGTWDRLAARDADSLAAYAARTRVTVCGIHGFLILARLLPPGASPHRLRYDTSGAQLGDYTNSVSYLAAAFTAPATGADELTSEEMRRLHRLATAAVEQAARGRADPSPADIARGIAVDGRLARDAGAFVTLKKKGVLRGCIGFIEAHGALWQAVVEMAAAATLHDPRFSPVRPDELADLEIEVSVLSPLRPIPSWRDFVPGRHGIVLSKAGRRAVYLPEVATEQGWDAPTTLANLSEKAGLPDDAWREGATFEVFTSQAYSAPFRAGAGNR